MNEKPISPLRQRMIEDMMVRNFIEKAQRLYPSRPVARGFPSPLTRHRETRRPAALPTASDANRCAPTEHQCLGGGIRFFFTVTLDRPDMARHLTFVREPRKIPSSPSTARRRPDIPLPCRCAEQQ
jgi:integrase/recombinase XerD